VLEADLMSGGRTCRQLFGCVLIYWFLDVAGMGVAVSGFGDRKGRRGKGESTGD